MSPAAVDDGNGSFTLTEGLEKAIQAPPAGLEAGGGPTIPCRVAVVVMRAAQTRADRLNLLMLVVAVIALVAIVAAIVVFLVAGDATATALVTFVSGLLGGGLAGVIKSERDEAKADRDGAQRILNRQCRDQTAEDVLSAIGL